MSCTYAKFRYHFLVSGAQGQKWNSFSGFFVGLAFCGCSCCVVFLVFLLSLSLSLSLLSLSPFLFVFFLSLFLSFSCLLLVSSLFLLLAFFFASFFLLLFVFRLVSLSVSLAGFVCWLVLCLCWLKLLAACHLFVTSFFLFFAAPVSNVVAAL